MSDCSSLLGSRTSDSSTSTSSTSNHALNENFQSSTPSDFDVKFVNGMIFVCSEETTFDMFKHQIFGLPIAYLREMKSLVPGRSALFLIEKQTQLIRGVFVPTCPARRLINDKIWLSGRQKHCSYPAQIKFELHSSYPALSKDSPFAPNFLQRMKIKGKFLDEHRVNLLMKALEQNKNQQSQAFNCNFPSMPPSFGNMFSQQSPFNMNMTPPLSPVNGEFPGRDGRNYDMTNAQRQRMFMERYLKQKKFFELFESYLALQGMLPPRQQQHHSPMNNMPMFPQQQQQQHPSLGGPMVGSSRDNSNDLLLQNMIQNMWCSSPSDWTNLTGGTKNDGKNPISKKYK